MNKFKPLVSIIVPVYNGSDYMREAIDSALSQTYTNIEIIVINDGSNDNGLTEKIVLEYGDKIKYINKENGGVSTALNIGIENMRGEYFSWLSHDDVYTPDKIEKSIEALMKQDNKKTIVYCGSCHIDKDSNEISRRQHNGNSCIKETLYTWQEALLLLQKQGSMNGCAFLIHKSILKECDLFDENLRFNQDGFMWNKIFLKKYPLVSIPDICVKNRIHDNQLTQKAQALFHTDCEKMSEFLIPKLLEASDADNNFILQYALNNAKYANYKVVRNIVCECKEKKVISIGGYCRLYLMSIYGKIRPKIRMIYYLLCRGIKTS